MIRHLADLASDPEVAAAGKGLVERTLDLVVHAADGVDPAAILRLVPAGRGPAGRGGSLRRSLGIEELTGAAGHRRHPTDAVSGHLHVAGGGTIGVDGESARWPRHGPLC